MLTDVLTMHVLEEVSIFVHLLLFQLVNMTPDKGEKLLNHGTNVLSQMEVGTSLEEVIALKNSVRH